MTEDQSIWKLDKATAKALDEADPLKSFRAKFHIPIHNGNEWIYLCGNSLGLQPRSVKEAVDHELNQWQNLAVEGWFEGNSSWLSYHDSLSPTMAKIVGAKAQEVVIMNTLTVNLHLLMASFYKPDGRKTKVLMEKDAFPSDHHMVASQIEWHGLDPSTEIIYIHPEENGLTADEQICSTIHKRHEEIALVLLGGVNYYSGQLFDIHQISDLCHDNDICIGLDLAHAVGNVPLRLHEWGVDFAAWCTYKYLNSGPGGPGGIFVHESQSSRSDMHRLAGWWGHDESSRFEMKDTHIPMAGAAGWQISTVQVMNMVGLKESLKIFEEAGMVAIDKKRRTMNDYFDFLIQDLQKKGKCIQCVTPRDKNRRGAQYSLRLGPKAKSIFNQLSEEGIIGDWREPDMIRLSPAPLYNTYQELYQVYTTLMKLV